MWVFPQKQGPRDLRILARVDITQHVSGRHIMFMLALGGAHRTVSLGQVPGGKSDIPDGSSTWGCPCCLLPRGTS